MDCEARVHIPGRFSVYNSLVTMLVCHLAGISDQAILDGLNKVQVKGRVEMLPVSKDYYLIIDYAHNEVSTRSVLTTLMEYHPKRLICVYGGGGNRSKLRRYDMGEVTGEMADLCVLTAIIRETKKSVISITILKSDWQRAMESISRSTTEKKQSLTAW